MTNKLDDIAREYRKIAAPEQIAARVRARTADRPVASHGWLPAGTAAVVAVVVVGMLSTLWRPAGDVTTSPVRPSLSAIAALRIDKPAFKPPSLGSIRTPAAPKMPSKPRLDPDGEQSRNGFEDTEEKQHAHT